MNFRDMIALGVGGALAVGFVLLMGETGRTGFGEAQQTSNISSAVGSTPKKQVGVASATADAKQQDWRVPDINTLADDPWGKLVRFGRELTVNTSNLIGPGASSPAMHYAGSNISCQSCHLEAATKQYGLPWVGVFADFPQYRAREGEVGTLEDRINGCMTRSLNGKPLPVDSTEMKAFVAYIKFLSVGRPIGASTPGRGSGEMPELNRAADPKAGAVVFADNCSACHGADGLGKRSDKPGQHYQYPPLWGPDSFNNGAGMARLISAANFIHSNMPYGTSFDQPVLTVEQAWDVAAYVQSMERPQKAALDKDYPVGLQKAIDAAYGPYVDGFSQEQHKYGPYGPIREKIKQLKQQGSAKSTTP